MSAPSTLALVSTDEVGPGDRVAFWSDHITRQFGGLASDLYGDHDFDGHMSSTRAGEVVLTRLEANRHRVLRTDRLLRGSDNACLKIVAPRKGLAVVHQQGRAASVEPGTWSIYDTTDRYAVDNPGRVEHLIVMLPKARLLERGLSVSAITARRLGQTGASRLALHTMRQAFQELPTMSAPAAQAVGEVICQLVQVALLELAGCDSAASQRETLRERIKALVAQRLGDPALTVDAIAEALNCSRRHLYNAFADEPDGVAGYVQAQRLAACCRSLADPAQRHRSITTLALDHGFTNPAHFSRVFRARTGLAPSDYRRVGLAG